MLQAFNYLHDYVDIAFNRMLLLFLSKRMHEIPNKNGRCIRSNIEFAKSHCRYFFNLDVRNHNGGCRTENIFFLIY